MRFQSGLSLLCVLLLSVCPTIADEAEVLDLDTAKATEDVLVAGEAVETALAETVETVAGDESLPVVDEEAPVVTDEADVPEEAAPTSVQEAEQKTAPDQMSEATTRVEEGIDASPDTLDEPPAPVQSGPFIDLFGPTLLSLEMLDEAHAQLQHQYTSDALRGKKVVGVYFSADWCGPCRQFTPELTSFYTKMNARRRKQNEFEIVWVSRCRDTHSFGQYFTQMGGWVALPPEEAMGERGQWLSEKLKVKGIPTLVLLDDLGNVITRDGRNKIPQDRAGIGFPWRNPIATLYMTVLPRSLRLMLKSHVVGVKDRVFDGLKRLVKPGKSASTAT